MAININNELFKRYAPKKKIEIIENLTSSELLATTPATMERIIKEAGRYQYKSVDKRLFISRDRQEGNSWNSMVEALELIKGKLYLEDFSKPKIIWGEISDKSKFAFDFFGEYIPEATSFYMKGECIEYLLSALNSSVSEWLFSKVGTTTGVGTIRWKKYTIEQLIVAKLSTEQLNTHLAAFNDLKVGKMSITDFECFSNKLMYDVYKLTSDEIQYIENQQIV